MDTGSQTMRAFAARQDERRVSTGQRHLDRLRIAAPALAEMLVRDHGALRVWLFGSLAWGAADGQSDLDLATEGLPTGEYFRALGALLERAPGRVDLVRLEDAPESLRARILAEGEVLLDRQPTRSSPG